MPDNTRNLAGEWQRYDAHANNALLRGDLALGDNWALTLETGRAETVRDRRYSQFQNYDLSTGEGSLAIFFNNGQRFINKNHRMEVMGRLASGPLQHEVTLGYTHNDRDAYLGESAPNATVPQNPYNPRPVAPLNPAITTRGAIRASPTKACTCSTACISATAGS